MRKKEGPPLPFNIGEVHLRPEGFFKVSEFSDIDPLAIVPRLPYSGVGYLIEDDGFLSNIAHLLGLRRLERIRQLAFLHYPMEKNGFAVMFNHTRYLHSLDVLVLATILGWQTELEENEFRHLQFAALTHDIMTPAGGDSTKLADPSSFNEDLLYTQIFETKGFKELKVTYDLDQDLLETIIKGEGVLGVLLDLADKSAYVGRDTEALKSFVGEEDIKLDQGLREINTLLTEDPEICALWRSARIIEGKVVLEDPAKLYRFLKLRALFFKHFYYNPKSRFWEYVVGKAFTKYLLQTGSISAETLLTEGDEWLERKISEELSQYWLSFGYNSFDDSRYEEFDSFEEAVERAKKFDANDNMLAIVEEFAPQTSAKASRFNVCVDSKIAPFSKAFPDKTQEIRGIIALPKTHFLFLISMNDIGIPAQERKRLKAILKGF